MESELHFCAATKPSDAASYDQVRATRPCTRRCECRCAFGSVRTAQSSPRVLWNLTSSDGDDLGCPRKCRSRCLTKDISPELERFCSNHARPQPCACKEVTTSFNPSPFTS